MIVTQLNKSSWIRGGGVRPTHFPPRSPMWRGVVPHVVLCDTCAVDDREWYPYAHIRRTGYSSWMDRILDKYYPVTVCYYMDGNIRRQTSRYEYWRQRRLCDKYGWKYSSTIHYEVNKYLPVLTPTKFIQVTTERTSISRSSFQRPRVDKFKNPTSDYRESGYLATSRGCRPGI